MGFLLPLFILKGLALEGQMPQTNGGLCLDPQMMSAVCTINTQIGTAMEEAHLKCAAAAQVEEREKKTCILKEVGWVSQDGNIMPDSIMAGINTLDPRMSEGLSDTNELCSAQAGNVTIENMFSGEEFVEVEIQAEKTPVTADDDCKVEKIDQTKVASIEESLRKLSYVACVHGNFMTACGNFILDQMGEMVRYMTEDGFTSLSAQNSTNA